MAHETDHGADHGHHDGGHHEDVNDPEVYKRNKKAVFSGMWLLGAVTLIEVGVSLFGKGHLGYLPTGKIILGIIGFLLIALSLYKAYFIIYKFMHMGHEVRDLRMSVLLPTLLLVWAVIAFFQEGSFWGDRRAQIKEFNKENVDKTSKPSGMNLKNEAIKKNAF